MRYRLMVCIANVMLAYYQRLFPFKKLFLWLNQDHTPTRHWTHREFAFTLQNDAYLRYNSFSNAEDLKKEVLRLNPSRFEIGPVYSARVRWSIVSADPGLRSAAAKRQENAQQSYFQTSDARAGL